MKTLLFYLTLMLLIPCQAETKQDRVLEFYQNRGVVLARIADSRDQALGEKIIKQVYASLKIPLKVIPMPAKRALREAHQGNVIDGEVMRIARIGDLYTSLIKISPPIYSVDAIAYSKRKDIKVNGWSSLSQYYVGIVSGKQFSLDGTRNFEHVAEVSDDEKLMKLLVNDLVDVVVTNSYNGNFQLEKQNLTNIIHPLSPTVASSNLYHYLNIKHRELVPLIEGILKELQAAGTLQRMHQQLEVN